MSLTMDQLATLPSPFYRVAVKALIFNDDGELLVLENRDGQFEIPGGGWEHGETMRECLARECIEEIGVEPASMSDVDFVFQSTSDHGWHVIRLVVRAELASTNFACGDGMVAARYVSADGLRRLDLVSTDARIVDYIDRIWKK